MQFASSSWDSTRMPHSICLASLVVVVLVSTAVLAQSSSSTLTACEHKNGALYAVSSATGCAKRGFDNQVGLEGAGGSEAGMVG